MVLLQDGSVGGGEEVGPVDVVLGEGVSGRGKPDPKGNSIAHHSLHTLTGHRQHHTAGKHAFRRRPHTTKTALHPARSTTAIVINVISVVAPLGSTDVYPISAFGRTFIGGGVVIVPRSLITSRAYVSISVGTVETARHQTFYAGLDVGVIVGGGTDCAGC